MKNLVPPILVFLFLFFVSCSSEEVMTQNNPENQSNTFYFPPVNSSVWETTSPESLGWNTINVQMLLDFLEEKNSKSFIILYKGKIVLENYFNGHNENSLWYWASAGKTLTTAVTGIAQDEGLLNIDHEVSTYLGEGWTSAPSEKEDLITCKNLLSMTSGLDDTLGDSVTPENLQYVSDSGTRWAYHNVYVKMQDVIAQASNLTWSEYFNLKLKNKIGMSGNWVSSENFNVYWSTTRSMARFGLMMSAKGKWENDQIVSESFLTEAISTSQNINAAYGYLWWLNGKTTYHLPQTQFEFAGELMPNAPADMYAALGRNDQKIYIVPGKNLVIVRMGNAADEENFALSSFDNDLWEKINLVIN